MVERLDPGAEREGQIRDRSRGHGRADAWTTAGRRHPWLACSQAQRGPHRPWHQTAVRVRLEPERCHAGRWRQDRAVEPLVSADDSACGTPVPRSRAKHRKGGSVPEPTRRWKDVVADEPVNEARAEIYARLMDAQERIAQARYERGVDHATVLAALDAADETLSESERREDLYLAALAHFVERSAANSRCGPCSRTRRSSSRCRFRLARSGLDRTDPRTGGTDGHDGRHRGLVSEPV